MFIKLESTATYPELYKIENEEVRKNRYDKVKHFFACVIFIPYIILLFGQSFFTYDIPNSYENLALIVIGYYFAKFI